MASNKSIDCASGFARITLYEIILETVRGGILFLRAGSRRRNAFRLCFNIHQPCLFRQPARSGFAKLAGYFI
jgi:hypothetical protein